MSKHDICQAPDLSIRAASAARMSGADVAPKDKLLTMVSAAAYLSRHREMHAAPKKITVRHQHIHSRCLTTADGCQIPVSVRVMRQQARAPYRKSYDVSPRRRSTTMVMRVRQSIDAAGMCERRCGRRIRFLVRDFRVGLSLPVRPRQSTLASNRTHSPRATVDPFRPPHW
jgi:hypothetical protein